MKIKKTINIIYAVLASVALAWFAFSSTARALNPPPDGGYPGFNTAEGQKALFSLTTGVGNAAVGWYSLFSNTEGSFNTATGVGRPFQHRGQKYGRWGCGAFITTPRAPTIQPLARVPS